METVPILIDDKIVQKSFVHSGNAFSGFNFSITHDNKHYYFDFSPWGNRVWDIELKHAKRVLDK